MRGGGEHGPHESPYRGLTGNEILGSNDCDGFSDEGFLCFLPETVVSLLELVELWKNLVVLPCIVSSVKMNEISRPLGRWVTRLVWKDVQPIQSVKLIYHPTHDHERLGHSHA